MIATNAVLLQAFLFVQCLCLYYALIDSFTNSLTQMSWCSSLLRTCNVMNSLYSSSLPFYSVHWPQCRCCWFRSHGILSATHFRLSLSISVSCSLFVGIILRPHFLYEPSGVGCLLAWPCHLQPMFLLVFSLLSHRSSTIPRFYTLWSITRYHDSQWFIFT